MLKGRGIEIRHVFPLVVSPVRERASHIPGFRQLLTSMTYLRRAYRLIDESGYEVPPDKCDDLEHYLKHCIVNAREAKVKLLPKFHTLIHLSPQCRAAGSLRHVSTLEDESLNADSVRIAAASHTKDVMARLLEKQRLMLQIELDILDLIADTFE